MTKADIVAKDFQKKLLGMEKEVQATAESFMDNKNSLKMETNVYLRGFGSFIIKTRAEKLGETSPKKNTTIKIPCQYSRIQNLQKEGVKPTLKEKCYSKSRPKGRDNHKSPILC